MNLKSRHTEGGSDGSADLGGEVRKRREVVSEDGRFLSELCARDLHAVTGVSGEADHYLLDDFTLRAAGRCRVAFHFFLSSPSWPRWIRTTIAGSKGRSPAVGRGASDVGCRAGAM